MDWDTAPGVAPGEAEVAQEPSTQEELKRLCELMAEQRAHLERLVKAQEQTEADNDNAEGLLELMFQGDESLALDVVAGLRPDALMNMSDPAGMTPLHWAVRMGSLKLVFAILDKAPQLCDKATNMGRAPPHWTPLMVLADQGVGQNPHHHQMGSALIHQMSVNGLQTRGGTLATATFGGGAWTHPPDQKDHVAAQRLRRQEPGEESFGDGKQPRLFLL